MTAEVTETIFGQLQSYGMLTIVGNLMPNSVLTLISNIYEFKTLLGQDMTQGQFLSGV